MPTNQAVPFFKPGHDVTGYLTAPLSGKRLVATTTGSRGSQPYIAYPKDGGPVFGVLAYDGVAGDTITVFVGGVVPIIAGADVTAGTQVQAKADGTIVPLTDGVPVGYVVAAATTGKSAAVKLYG